MDYPEQIASYMNGRVTAVIGDLTRQHVDAIVNAANSELLGGGGVDGAIHAAGGPGILRECREIRRTSHPEGLPTGEAVITTGGNLPAHFVIHTVGPVYGSHGGRETGLLSGCYLNSLRLAVENELTTVAFPAISTGVYRYPREKAAEVASQAIEDFLRSNSSIREVRLVFRSEDDAQVFVANQWFSDIDSIE